MSGFVAKWTGAGTREPTRDEVDAARQVVDLFATEALLAMDRYERSLPADMPDKARRTADRFAHWWHALELDDVRLDRSGTDAEQLLAKVSDLAIAPDNGRGVNLGDVSGLARREAANNGRRIPAKGIADFRKEFEQTYGGRANEPSHDDTWLAESLTRFARASLLRDVVESGAKVRVSEPLREAADVLVRQGQQLIDDRANLDRNKERASDKSALRRAESRLTTPYLLLCAGIQAATMPLPPAVGIASQLTLGGMYLNNIRQLRREHREAAAVPDPAAQDQVVFDRDDLVGTLNTPPPATRRDLRALRDTTNRRTGPSR
ncbi:hypothetical protein ACFV9C_31230 [Kribbella sp. NPDC059898]|uniref:hypothetical protein n=1 Tax=Kribbella sp. NPDC059898 TaxID=3346995 RepID=UPI00365E2D97